MIGWRTSPTEQDTVEPRAFDDFDLRLGDVMRGERATLGKSLLDVQRELKIKATYIAAIENADLSAFETPGFVAGNVRSYSRYLGLDPDWAFETFCAEAGFTPASGIGPASRGEAVKGPVYRKDPFADAPRDPIAEPRVSFAPNTPSPLMRLEARAIGSTIVLLALIAGIGYGGWAVLQEVQRVTVAPVERAPEALAQVDPLEGVAIDTDTSSADIAASATPDALERLYRPEALDVPVMIARDGPIASIDPGQMGVLTGPAVPGGPEWSDPRDLYAGPPTGLPAPRGGDALAAAIDGALGLTPGAQVRPFVGTGPAGVPGAPGLAGSPSLSAGPAAVATFGPGAPQFGQGAGPRVTEEVPEVVLVAVRSAWVRVRAADRSVLLERIMEPGDTWVVPATEAPPTLRTGAAGAVYFAVNGQTYGPAGPNGAVVDGIALNSGALTQDFVLADPAASDDAREAVRVAEAALRPEPELVGPTQQPTDPAQTVGAPTQ